MGFCFALIASTYGWTHSEILALSARQFFMYVEQVPVLRARDQLSAFEVVSFPNMEEKDRKETLEYYQKTITDRINKPKTNQKEIDDNWDLLRRGIIPND